MKREIHIPLIAVALICFASGYHDVLGQQAVVKELLWYIDSKTIECSMQSLQQQCIELMIRSSDSVWAEKSKTYSMEMGKSIMICFVIGETRTFNIKLMD